MAKGSGPDGAGPAAVIKYGSIFGPVGSLTNLSMAGVKSAGAIMADASSRDNLLFTTRTLDLSASEGVMRKTADKMKTEVMLEIEGAADLHFLAVVD